MKRISELYSDNSQDVNVYFSQNSAAETVKMKWLRYTGSYPMYGYTPVTVENNSTALATIMSFLPYLTMWVLFKGSRMTASTLSRAILAILCAGIAIPLDIMQSTSF